MYEVKGMIIYLFITKTFADTINCEWNTELLKKTHDSQMEIAVLMLWIVFVALLGSVLS